MGCLEVVFSLEAMVDNVQDVEKIVASVELPGD